MPVWGRGVGRFAGRQAGQERRRLITAMAARAALAAQGRLSAALIPLAALSAREQVFDLPNDSGAVEGPVDGGGADE